MTAALTIRPQTTTPSHRYYEGYGPVIEVRADEWSRMASGSLVDELLDDQDFPPVFTLLDGSRAVLTTPDTDGVSVAFRYNQAPAGRVMEGRLVTA